MKVKWKVQSFLYNNIDTSNLYNTRERKFIETTKWMQCHNKIYKRIPYLTKKGDELIHLP